MYISCLIALVVCILWIQTVCFCVHEDVFGIGMHVLTRCLTVSLELAIFYACG